MQMKDDLMKQEWGFCFRRHVDPDDIQDVLSISICAIEDRFGHACLRRDGGWEFDRQRRRCTIYTGSELGQELAKLFTESLAQVIGDSGFSLSRPQESST